MKFGYDLKGFTLIHRAVPVWHFVGPDRPIEHAAWRNATLQKFRQQALYVSTNGCRTTADRAAFSFIMPSLNPSPHSVPQRGSRCRSDRLISVQSGNSADSNDFPQPPLLAASPSSTMRALLSMHGVKCDQDDEGQKCHQLDAKERKSHRHECVGLNMSHVNCGLHDSRSDNSDGQSIDNRT
jgi:hypothetical protein